MIKKAELHDLPEILHLQYLAYQSEAALVGSRDIQPLKQTLNEVIAEFQSGIILKMTDGCQIIGSVRAKEQDGTVYIGKLMVHPAHQRKGHGSELLAAIEGCFPGKRYELFTSTRSADNLRLYQKRGYTEFARKAVNDELEFVYLEKYGTEVRTCCESRISRSRWTIQKQCSASRLQNYCVSVRKRSLC